MRNELVSPVLCVRGQAIGPRQGSHARERPEGVVGSKHIARQSRPGTDGLSFAKVPPLCDASSGEQGKHDYEPECVSHGSVDLRGSEHIPNLLLIPVFIFILELWRGYRACPEYFVGTRKQSASASVQPAPRPLQRRPLSTITASHGRSRKPGVAIGPQHQPRFGKQDRNYGLQRMPRIFRIESSVADGRNCDADAHRDFHLPPVVRYRLAGGGRDYRLRGAVQYFRDRSRAGVLLAISV